MMLLFTEVYDTLTDQPPLVDHVSKFGPLTTYRSTRANSSTPTAPWQPPMMKYPAAKASHSMALIEDWGPSGSVLSIHAFLAHPSNVFALVVEFTGVLVNFRG